MPLDDTAACSDGGLLDVPAGDAYECTEGRAHGLRIGEEFGHIRGQDDEVRALGIPFCVPAANALAEAVRIVGMIAADATRMRV